MAFEANLGTPGRHYLVSTPEERARAFRSARRHSFLVSFLRRALPFFSVLVLGTYFVSTRMNVTVGDFTASIDGMEVADGNLRMLNPTLRGADKNNGKYVVTAEYADQDIKNPNVIKLHAIKADIDDPAGGWSKMQAVRGVFDSKAERLIMKDRITIATSSGLTGELKYATLDMATQTLRSHNPVVFEVAGGTVRANAMTLRSKENTLLFRGRVAVHLEPNKLRAAREVQAAQPAPPATPPAAAPQTVPPQ
ncbi:MAG: LPS export ABC transporter periplasmic protein LptC [Alphaproteobacteria bacterium]